LSISVLELRRINQREKNFAFDPKIEFFNGWVHPSTAIDVLQTFSFDSINSSVVILNLSISLFSRKLFKISFKKWTKCESKS
jgi:hypothetical protein